MAVRAGKTRGTTKSKRLTRQPIDGVLTRKPRVLADCFEGSTRAWLVATLTSAGFEVETISAETDPVAKVMSGNAHLVMLCCTDMRRAVATCHSLKRSPETAGTPILALLPAEQHFSAAEILAAGANDFIRHPIDDEELIVRVRHQLRVSKHLETPEQQRHTLGNIVDVYRSVSSTLDSDQVLSTIVRKVADATSAARSSIVLIDKKSQSGYVLATYENPTLKDLVIKLDNYPEIQHAIETKEVVAIDQMGTHPVTKRVRKQAANLGSASVLVVPILWEEEVLGTVLLHARRPGKPFSQEEINFCKLVANASLNAIKNASLFRAVFDEKTRLEALAITDALTGIFNRSYLDARLQEEFDRARRYGQPFAYVMLDIDNFKRINDTYGHVVGDRVLTELASRIKHSGRKTDLVARYGGEEFGILLPNCDVKGAALEAERVRAAVADHRFADLPESDHITVSLGVAAYPATGIASVYDLVVSADIALYRAKREGKNRICGGDRPSLKAPRSPATTRSSTPT